uniref:Xylanase n=1 Tax=uncultured microorganism TaxID=358574 RepID=A0A291FAJ3_9ZZZZ|nr:xylanase [uncultured microorganism]
MQTITSRDGTQIAYQRTGSGPPLVFVHGSWTNHTAWGLVLPILAEQFTVFAIDRRGCGQSGPYGDGHVLEREFEDVATAVDLVGEPVHLVGHSIGALCALYGALLTPNVRSLTLYEPPLGGPDPIPEDVVERIAALIADGDPEGAALVFRHEIVGSPRQDREQFRASANYAAVMAGVRALPLGLRACARFRFEPDRVRTLRIPTLLLVGGETTTYYRGTAATVAAALPNVQTVELPGQGHGAHTTAPQLLAAEILRFLTVEGGSPERAFSAAC